MSRFDFYALQGSRAWVVDEEKSEGKYPLYSWSRVQQCISPHKLGVVGKKGSACVTHLQGGIELGNNASVQTVSTTRSLSYRIVGGTRESSIERMCVSSVR